MKTIQMTIDEALLSEVDRMVDAQDTTRSDFVRRALRLALRHHKILELERRHAEGYARHPVTPGEFDVWIEEQSWDES